MNPIVRRVPWLCLLVVLAWACQAAPLGAAAPAQGKQPGAKGEQAEGNQEKGGEGMRGMGHMT